MRFEFAKIQGQFFILPSLGIIYHSNTSYAPRIAMAWLCWGCSLGIGKYSDDIDRVLYESRMKEVKG